MTHKKKKSRPSPSTSSLAGSKSGKDDPNRFRKPRIPFETSPHSTEDQQDQNPSQAKKFPIVGIGASAGGFEAFTKLFAAMPGDIGQVKILSKKEEGTRVHLTVPVTFTKAPLETSPFPALSVDSRLGQKEKGVSRVLLADDHAMFREGMRTLLETCPDIHVVGEAENGEQANSLAHSLQPDVVVMDINMPVMNGIEATRLIKQSLPVVYVIGLSMRSDQIVKKAFFDAGGDHYVTKGDSFDSFAELIRASQGGSLPTE